MKNRINEEFDQLLTDAVLVEELPAEEITIQPVRTGWMDYLGFDQYEDMPEVEPMRRRDKPHKDDWR